MSPRNAMGAIPMCLWMPLYARRARYGWAGWARMEWRGKSLTGKAILSFWSLWRLSLFSVFTHFSRFQLLGQHGAHHIPGIFGMIRDRSDNLGQPDQMKNRDRINVHIEQASLEGMLDLIGLMFLLT